MAGCGDGSRPGCGTASGSAALSCWPGISVRATTACWCWRPAGRRSSRPGCAPSWRGWRATAGATAGGGRRGSRRRRSRPGRRCRPRSTSAPVLRRERRWRALAAASGAGAAAGGALALWLAGQGAGIWAPAAQLVVQRFGETAALWLAAGRRLPRAGGGRDAGAPGGRLDLAALAAALPAVARRGPALIALGVLGPVAAGLFFVALRLGEALADIVAAPLRDGAARRLDPRLLLAAAVPAALGSAALLTAAVPALTAPRWWGVVAPARLLLPAAVPAVLIAWRKAALAAAGKRAAEARWQAAEAALCCAAAALAAPFGLEAAAAALLA